MAMHKSKLTVKQIHHLYSLFVSGGGTSNYCCSFNALTNQIRHCPPQRRRAKLPELATNDNAIQPTATLSQQQQKFATDDNAIPPMSGNTSSQNRQQSTSDQDISVECHKNSRHPHNPLQSNDAPPAVTTSRQTPRTGNQQRRYPTNNDAIPTKTKVCHQ